MTAAPPGWLPDTGADPQALIKEARRRQRRRHLWTGLVTIALLAGYRELQNALRTSSQLAW
jgi:hypothetical protein